MSDDDFAGQLEQAKRASTAHLLFRCARLLNEHAIATVPSVGGNRPRAAHLALFPHIDLDGGTRVTHIAQKLGITKQAVGQLVDDLVGIGIVERRPDPNDGRAKRVCFTEEGKRSMLEGLAHLRTVDAEVAALLGQERMTALHEALITLYDHLERTTSE